MSSCCEPQASEVKKSIDWLLVGSLSAIALLITLPMIFPPVPLWLHVLGESCRELLSQMWWGILIGMVMVAILAKVPREFVLSILGTKKGMAGLLRATAAGLLLDLCSHGILMVGAKLYERGASTGQVMAFLIASPWNSMSLTFILIALIGLSWTLAFIFLSFVVAIVSGWIFDRLVASGTLPDNPFSSDLREDFRFWPEARAGLSHLKLTPTFFKSLVVDGVKESRMVLRWIFFGILLASLVRVMMDSDQFAAIFGPTILGLLATLVAATVIEVCSEGSVPIASDIFSRAQAPGNSFTFLMSGVATDYTEIMVLKERTSSWKVALFLPLITVPQVLILGWLLNSL